MKNITSILIASLLTMTTSTFATAHPQESTVLEQALSGEHRSDKNKARDQYRHPKQTLEFFGFNSSMTVVEIAPGGGWYTEILAPALKDHGTFYGAHYPDTGKDDYFSNSRRKLEKKLAGNDVYSDVKLTNFVPKQKSELAPAGTADLVLTFRNLHNWKEEGVKQVFADAFAALKPGGVLGVVEHRMPENQDFAEHSKSGYFPTAMAVDLAKAAGFKLAGSSEVNANSKDIANHPKGVWTLPPVLRLGEKDKAKYLAIGESDRMTLKFVKPVK